MSGVSVAKKNGGQTSAIFANDTRWRPNSQILHRRDRSNSRVTETARPSGVPPFGRAIIIIFMMCRFNEYAGFTWSSCHAGVVRFLLDGCYGRWFVYVKQRTASRWPLRAGGICTLLRTSFVDINTYRHWVLIVDQWDQGNILMQWPEPVR